MIDTPIGHQEILSSLIKAAEQSKLHQTLLFTGPSGIGKRTVAEYLAYFLLCENIQHGTPCGKCESCHLALVGNHPDLFLFSPAKKEESTVEALRVLLGRLSMKSYRGKAKVVVVDAADEFTLAAANIFLKTLEEPRPDLYFILVAENASRLPITIRSRAQRWEFKALSDDSLLEVLKHCEKKEQLTVRAAEPFIPYADGSMMHLRKCLEVGETFSELQAWVENIVQEKCTESLSFLPAITKDKAHLASVISVLILIVRHNLRHSMMYADSFVHARLAIFLQDLIASQYVLFERHINPLMVLTEIIVRAAGWKAEHSITAEQQTLGERVSRF